ncbi:probable cytochrome P450 6d2 [Drosophila montana]|uniref:probable cytochrome P450 6d2 n=1 Tax=Drosophila montana TaxID=40370 RepID=UPI00313D0AFC
MESHKLERGGKFTYKALQDLKFLDKCIMETIRKYPGLPFLNRECTQDFDISFGHTTRCQLLSQSR